MERASTDHAQASLVGAAAGEFLRCRQIDRRSRSRRTGHAQANPVGAAVKPARYRMIDRSCHRRRTKHEWRNLVDAALEPCRCRTDGRMLHSRIHAQRVSQAWKMAYQKSLEGLTVNTSFSNTPLYHVSSTTDEPDMSTERVKTTPGNPFSHLISSQDIAIIPSFELETGVTLRNVSVAYKTYGQLSPQKDNCMVICDALTGSADVADWWGPLLGGAGKASDVEKFFVVCLNSLGSPYGSASPVTPKDGDESSGLYGPGLLQYLKHTQRLHRIRCATLKRPNAARKQPKWEQQ